MKKIVEKEHFRINNSSEWRDSLYINIFDSHVEYILHNKIIGNDFNIRGKLIDSKDFDELYNMGMIFIELIEFVRPELILNNPILYKKILGYLKLLSGITLYFLSQLKVLLYFILQKLYNSTIKTIELILNNDKESRKNIKNYFEISKKILIVIIFYQIFKTIDKIFL